MKPITTSPANARKEIAEAIHGEPASLKRDARHSAPVSHSYVIFEGVGYPPLSVSVRSVWRGLAMTTIYILAAIVLVLIALGKIQFRA